jgi:hypothetical protein
MGAVDAHSAMAQLSESRVDLALVATALTGVAGRALVAALERQTVPLALITGSFDQTGVDTGLATAGVLNRPLRVAELRDLVSRVQDGSLSAQTFLDEDPIDAWLSGADEQLGFMKTHSRRRDLYARAESAFERDVRRLRAEPRRHRLTVAPSQVF